MTYAKRSVQLGSLMGHNYRGKAVCAIALFPTSALLHFGHYSSHSTACAVEFVPTVSLSASHIAYSSEVEV